MIRTSQYVAASNDADGGKSAIGVLQATLSSSMKRSFDFVAALLGLLALSPVFALIAILIKRDTPGPVFYWGPRIGRHGKIFQMLKFRTMYEDKRSYQGARVTCKDDDRITPLGRWLRDTKLNELPQLWNVLKGDMSLVGPRPEDPTIGKTWPVSIARDILQVRPGITSPASVVYRDEESMLQAEEVMRRYLHELSPDKLRLDQLYVRYRSFWLDLDVIFWTFFLLLPRIRSYSPPEHFLFVGPVTRLIQRYVTWFVWDFLVVLLSIGLTGAVVRIFGPLDLGWAHAIRLALAFSAGFSLVGILLRIDRIDWRKATFWEAGRLWASWLIVIAACLGIQHYVHGVSFQVDVMILAASLFSLAGIISVRYSGRIMNGLFSRLRPAKPNVAALRERVLIVGSGRTAEQLAWLLDHPAYSDKFQVVGFIDDDLRARGMKIYGSEVIGNVKDIEHIIKQHDIGLVILADNRMAARKYEEFREIARFNPARVVVAPDVFGSLSGLEAAAPDETPAGSLDDFQCQHCLARYAPNAKQHRRISAGKGQERPRANRSRVHGKRAAWKPFGKTKKSS